MSLNQTKRESQEIKSRVLARMFERKAQVNSAALLSKEAGEQLIQQWFDHLGIKLYKRDDETEEEFDAWLDGVKPFITARLPEPAPMTLDDDLAAIDAKLAATPPGPEQLVWLTAKNFVLKQSAILARVQFVPKAYLMEMIKIGMEYISQRIGPIDLGGFVPEVKNSLFTIRQSGCRE